MPFLDKLHLEHVEGENWKVLTKFRYVWDREGIVIEVPSGYITDQASVPSIVLPIIVNDTGNIAKAAVVHDFGYTDLMDVMTKKEVDRMFYDAMLEAGVPKWRARIAYTGVRMNWVKAWKWNK